MRISYYTVCHHKMNSLAFSLAQNVAPKCDYVIRNVNVSISINSIHTYYHVLLLLLLNINKYEKKNTYKRLNSIEIADIFGIYRNEVRNFHSEPHGNLPI